MKKILVVGLGLMGGAYCYNLSKLDDYELYGIAYILKVDIIDLFAGMKSKI